MTEDFLLPSFKEQHALKLEKDKKLCLEFINLFLKEVVYNIKSYKEVYVYKYISHNIDKELLLLIFKKHYKDYYIDLRNKDWYLSLEYDKMCKIYNLVLRKANLFNRICWGLRNFALKFEKLYLGG